MSTNPQARAWMHVRADALRRNYRRIQDHVGRDVGVIPMVKSDAYGLGMAKTFATLRTEGPWGWGVATVPEGIELRALGATEPIVVFSPVPEVSVAEAVAADLQLTVSNLGAFRAVAEAAPPGGPRPGVHLDVDTGMGRSGFDWSTAGEWLPPFQEAVRSDLAWVGCFTHLHSADEGEASVREQWRRFTDVLERIVDPPEGLVVHVLNSPGVFRAPEYARSAVRPGKFLYGGSIGDGLPLPDRVVSVHARVVHVREASPGTSLGYGATYHASGPERWATLGIGYGDGLPRALGNRGRALVCESEVPIIGRISMDMTVVDITGVPAAGVGDVATLIGSSGPHVITLDDVAELAGTNSYEVLTGLTARLPRVWTGLEA